MPKLLTTIKSDFYHSMIKSLVNIAINLNNLEMLKIIENNFDIGKHLDNIRQYALIMSASNGLTGIVNHLLDNDVNIHFNDDAALHIAARNSKINTVIMLINHGANIYSQNGAMLSYFINDKHIYILRWLLFKGVDINSYDGLALILATINNQINTVHFLLDYAKQYNIRLKSLKEAFDIALNHNNTELILSFLHSNINFFDLSKAIKKCVSNKNMVLISYLVQNGANLSVCKYSDLIECFGSDQNIRSLINTIYAERYKPKYLYWIMIGTGIINVVTGLYVINNIL